jgi:predicted nuclease of predicted toxin-antitoxin system
VKLLLDEMYAPSVAALLRDLGHDVVAVKERADLMRLPDEDLVRAATAEGRAVVTEDVQDFAVLDRRIHAAAQHHPGLVLAHARRFPRSVGNHAQVLADALAAFLSEHGAILDDVESFVWWLERPDR